MWGIEERKSRRRSIGRMPWPKEFVRAGSIATAQEGMMTKIKREESTSSLFISFSFLQRTVNLLFNGV
jgi:hypothetical protein